MKAMNPADLCALLNGVENILFPAQQAKEALFQSLSCTECGSRVVSEVTTEDLADPKSLVPIGKARCISCNALMTTGGLLLEPGTVRPSDSG